MKTDEVAACRRVDVFLIKSAPAVLKRRQAALIFPLAVIYYFAEGDYTMAESKLRTLSIDFAVQILNLVKFLKNQHETIVSNQIGRAGTSIGANIHEAQYAHGKADFIAKLQIVKSVKIKVLFVSA